MISRVLAKKKNPKYRFRGVNFKNIFNLALKQDNLKYQKIFSLLNIANFEIIDKNVLRITWNKKLNNNKFKLINKEKSSKQ